MHFNKLGLLFLNLIRALQTWQFSSLTLLEQLALDPRSVTYPGSMLPVRYNMSQCMRFPTMWYVRPAKPQISLRIHTV